MKINSLDKFYFYTNKNKSMVGDVTFYLKSEVNADLLSKAAEKALDIFQHWKVRPYIDENDHIAFRGNDAPVPVCYDDKTYINLGTDESNGYLFRILYKDHRISLRAMHVLGDGNVMCKFMVHVIFYYLQELDPEIDGGGFIFSKTPETADDSLAQKAAEYLEHLQDAPLAECEEELPREERYVETFEMEHYYTDKARSIHILCDNNSYREYCGSHHASSTGVILDIIARSMYEAYGIENKRMDVCVAVDLRRQLESQSFHNFCSDIYVSYDYDMIDLDETKRAEILKSRMKKAIQTDILARRAKDYGALSELMEPYYTRTHHKAVEAKLEEQQKKDLVSYYISNIGQLPVPEDFHKYVDNICSSANPVKSETNYYLINYENRLNIIVRQNFDNIRVAELMVEKLNHMGIEASIVSNELFSYDYVSIENFENFEVNNQEGV